MRKLLTLLFGVCLFAPAVASASKVWTYDRVTWRTSANNNTGYVDSSVFRSTNVALGSLQIDTTAAISTRYWTLPDVALGGVADSASFWTFYLHRSRQGVLGNAEDSIYVFVQVSMNGQDWHTDSLSFHGVGVSVSNPTPAFPWSRIREDGTSGSFHANQHIVLGGPANPRWQVPNRGTLNYQNGVYGWPLIRLIVGHGATFTGEYEAYIGHWQERPERTTTFAWDNVSWRTSTSAGATVQGYVDSAYATGGPTSAKADTTAPIAINEWAVPALNVGAAADTSLLWVFAMARTNSPGSPTYADDSVYVVAQGSHDGVNWLRDTGSSTVAAFTNPQLTTVAGFSHAAVTPLLEHGDTGHFSVADAIPAGGVGGFRIGLTNYTSGAIPIWGYFGFRYMRFIIEGDHAGQYRAFFGRYQPLDAISP